MEENSFKFYYYRGHDWINNDSPDAFIEYPSLQELANEHYDGDTEHAENDTEYVFNEQEYQDWIKGEGKRK